LPICRRIIQADTFFNPDTMVKKSRYNFREPFFQAIRPSFFGLSKTSRSIAAFTPAM